NEEPHIDRLVTLPDDREMRLTGTATALDTGFDTGGSQTGACRDDLVTVDGEPVPVIERNDGGRGAFEACAPVVLTAGEHRITTSRTTADGILVDRLVFTSDAEGLAARPEPRGETAPAGSGV